MLIKGQAGDRAINLSMMESLCVDQTSVYAWGVNDAHYTLGTYSTPERAQAVLDEILEHYGKYLQINGGALGKALYTLPKVFIMPEK